MYNSGELRAPLVRLRCKEFDTAFYQELVHANQLFWANKPRPAPPRAKRRKVADDDDAEKDEDDARMTLVEDDKTEDDVAQSALMDGSSTASTSTCVSPSTELASAAEAASTSKSQDASVVVASAPANSPHTAPVSPSLSNRQTRSSTRRKASAATLKLRIPRRKLPHPPVDPMNADEEGEGEVESSESDDDDMYSESE